MDHCSRILMTALISSCPNLFCGNITEEKITTIKTFLTFPYSVLGNIAGLPKRYPVKPNIVEKGSKKKGFCFPQKLKSGPGRVRSRKGKVFLVSKIYFTIGKTGWT